MIKKISRAKRGKRQRWERLLAFFAGLLVILLVFEVSLRLLGKTHSEKVEYRSKVSEIRGCRDCFRVLCLGDSYTYGLGASAQNDYPAQLERLMNSRGHGKKYIVLNAGRGMNNTSMVLNDLPGHLREIEPDLVLLLLGGANRVNYWGYLSSMERKGLIPSLFSLFYRIRIFRAFRFLADRLMEREGGGAEDVPGGQGEEVGMDIDIEWYEKRGEGDEGGGSRGDDPFEKGRYLLKQGRYEEALEWFGKGIREEPGESRNYWGMGMACRGLHRNEEALAWYRKGLDADPDNPNIHYSMGEIHFETEMTGREESLHEALKWFEKGIEADPSFSGNYNGMGFCHMRMGDFEGAVRWFKKGIEVNPDDRRNYSNIAAAYIAWRKQSAAPVHLSGPEKEPLAVVDRAGHRAPPAGIPPTPGGQRRLEKSPLTDETMNLLRGLAKDHPVAGSYLKLFEKRDIVKEIDRWIEFDLNRIVETCLKDGVKVMILNYPSGVGIEVNIIKRAVARRYGIPLVDTKGVFDRLIRGGRRLEDFFIPDGHCNDRGYNVIARSVSEKIRESGIFPE